MRPDAPGDPHPPGDAVHQRDEHGVERLGRGRRPAERALGADRAPATAALHRPGIAVVGQGVQVAAGRPPEHRDQRRLAERGDLADRRDAPVVELGGRRRARRPRAARPGSGWRKASSPPVGTTSRPSGLATALATLARNFVRATPTVMGRPTRSRTSRRSRTADLRGRAAEPPQAAHVEERLVDREPLDQRRRVPEHLEHRLAGLGVGRHPGLDHDGLGAEAPRLRSAHRRAHAVRSWPRSWPRARRHPPTITGRPRRRGSSRCSTDA